LERSCSDFIEDLFRNFPERDEKNHEKLSRQTEQGSNYALAEQMPRVLPQNRNSLSLEVLGFKFLSKDTYLDLGFPGFTPPPLLTHLQPPQAKSGIETKIRQGPSASTYFTHRCRYAALATDSISKYVINISYFIGQESKIVRSSNIPQASVDHKGASPFSKKFQRTLSCTGKSFPILFP
jgi:hypothetical protein